MKKLVLASILTVICTSVAVAASGSMRFGQRISGSSPLAPDCGMAHSLDPTDGALGATSPQMDSEVEPHIAINPLNRNNIVAAWIQDRNKTGGGGRSNVVAVTFDGGERWETILVPGVSDCTGGSFARATDPWVDFDPDGIAYLASLTFETSEPSAVIVNTSRDGGRTWSEPATVTQVPELFQDKEQLSTHPRIAGRAYMTWMQRVPFLVDAKDAAMFSTTEDYGKTWSQPRRIFETAAFILPDTSEIMVLPDDSLLYVQGLSNMMDARQTGEHSVVPMVISARRSTDGGETWSLPVTITTRNRAFPRDPERDDKIINGANLYDVAIAPDGTAYVVWSDLDSTPQRVAISKSTDGGLTWSKPAAVGSGAGPFTLANVAVGHRGTVGVSYYDFRGDTDGDDALTTDAWFAYSRDGGISWSEEHLAGPFDLRQAPAASGYFLGDYTGLDAASGPDDHAPETFASAISVSPPLATAGAADIWFSTISLLPPEAAGGGGPTQK